MIGMDEETRQPATAHWELLVTAVTAYWELLTTEINQSAHAHPFVRSTPQAYDDVDVDEMKTFVGILLLMGIL